MAIHNSQYQHWDGEYLGIWRRRGVIAMNGIRACLANKWMRHIVTLCWVNSLALVAVLFLIGQLLVPDSVVVTWLGQLNPMLQTVGKGLMNWLIAHPEISVRTEQNLLFYLYCKPALFLSIIAVSMALPHLITRDLSSRAIIVYSSKAVNRWDYLMGKFGTIAGVLCLTWVGPMFFAWFLGNILAPNWNFFWHSRHALFNTMAYSIAGTLILSVIALGVSALSKLEKSVVGIWILLWLVTNAFADIHTQAREWLKYCSFQRNLEQIGLAFFKLADELQNARANIPMLSNATHEIRNKTIEAWQHPDIYGALLALGVMMALSLIVVLRKVKPE
jgi:hypothetical protein